MWQFNTMTNMQSLPEILKRPEIYRPQIKERERSPSPQQLLPVKKVKMKPRLPILVNLKRQSSQENLQSTQVSQKIIRQVSPRVKHKIIIKEQLLRPDKIPIKLHLEVPIKKSLIIDEYEVREKLGSGSYATVRKGVHQNGQIVAIKMYQKDRLIDSSRARSVAKEIETLRSCNHKNIIRLIKVVETQKYISLIEEYGGDRSLKGVTLSEEDIILIFTQILQAIDYLHNKGIMHRDIKLENVLLSQREIKVIDFGFADNFDNQSTYGTPSYMSPEMLSHKYDQKTDIWSCGILLYVLVHKKFPFSAVNEKDLHKRIRTVDPIITTTNSILNELLMACLQKDPSRRPSAEQLLRRL